jgi:hypothetical protein
MTTTTHELIGEIRAAHRRRRFAMKIQQKLDRALESFIRINATDWSPDMEEKDREKINNKVRQMIKDIRAGKVAAFAEVVSTSDNARAPADALRKTNEKRMEQLAASLPVFPWCESVRGIGALGLATIVAEANDIAGYPNVAKLWKRLGFAPYDGLAGSSWKRESWRPRALTREEWISNPFSGPRYALIFQIALWLRNAQWVGKAKSEDGVGKPDGRYGEVYAERRARTAVTHPDWSDGHADKDAIRVMMKTFLKDLWIAWHAATRPERPASEALKSKTALPGDPSVTQTSEKLKPSRPVSAVRRPAKSSLKPRPEVPGENSADHAGHEIQ